MHVPLPLSGEVSRPVLTLTPEKNAYQLRLPARFRSPDDHTMREMDVTLTLPFPIRACSSLPQKMIRAYAQEGRSYPYAIISPFQSWIPAVCIPHSTHAHHLKRGKGVLLVHETLEKRLHDPRAKRELENIITSTAEEFFFPLPGDFLRSHQQEGRVKKREEGDYHVYLPTLPAAYEQLVQCPHILNTAKRKQKNIRYHAVCPLTFLPEYLLLGIILPLPYRTRDVIL